MSYISTSSHEHHIHPQCSTSNSSKAHHCDLCIKSTALLDRILAFSKVVSEDSPFACCTCFKSFKQRAYVRKHIKLVHEKKNRPTTVQSTSPSTQSDTGEPSEADFHCRSGLGNAQKTLTTKCPTTLATRYKLSTNSQDAQPSTSYDVESCSSSETDLDSSEDDDCLTSDVDESSSCSKSEAENSIKTRVRNIHQAIEKTAQVSQVSSEPQSLVEDCEEVDSDTSSLCETVDLNTSDTEESGSTFTELWNTEVGNSFKAGVENSSEAQALSTENVTESRCTQAANAGNVVDVEVTSTIDFCSGPDIEIVEHPCQLCSKTFKSKHELALHQSVHRTKDSSAVSQLDKYCCNLCGIRFCRKIELDDHVDVVHRQCPCCLCDRIFKSQKALRQHLKDKHEKVRHRNFQVVERLCNQCDMKFSNERLLKIHQKEHKKTNFNSFGYSCGVSSETQKIPNLLMNPQNSRNRATSTTVSRPTINDARPEKECSSHISSSVPDRHSDAHVRENSTPKQSNNKTQCSATNTMPKTSGTSLRNRAPTSSSQPNKKTRIDQADGVNMYRCDYCFKSFFLKSSLEKHFYYHIS